MTAVKMLLLATMECGSSTAFVLVGRGKGPLDWVCMPMPTGGGDTDLGPGLSVYGA